MIITKKDDSGLIIVLENGKSFRISEHHTGQSDFILQVVQPNSGICIRPIRYEMIGITICEDQPNA